MITPKLSSASVWSLIALGLLSSAFSTPAWASHYFRAEYKISIQLGKLKEKTQDIANAKLEIDFSDSSGECRVLVHGKKLECDGAYDRIDGRLLFEKAQMVSLIHEVAGSPRYTTNSKISTWTLPRIRIHGVHVAHPPDEIVIGNPQAFFTVYEGDEREAYYVTIQQVGRASKLR